MNAKDVAQGLWEVKAEGRTVASEQTPRTASGRLPELDLAPGQEKEFKLAVPKTQAQPGVAVPKTQAQPGVEYWLNLSFVLKTTPYAPFGHEIAWEQFRLPDSAAAPRFSPGKVALKMKDEGGEATFTGPNFSLRSDKGRRDDFIPLQGHRPALARAAPGLLARPNRQRPRRMEGGQVLSSAKQFCES